MAEVTTLVCDMCSAAPAVKYTIVRGEDPPWMVDLCGQCAAPIGSFQSKGRFPEGVNRPYRRSRGRVLETNADGITYSLTPEAL